MKKSLTMPKKTERETLWGFSTSILSQNSKKLKGAFWAKNFPEKSLAMLEKIERDPLVSSGIVCYTGNFFGSVHWANGYNLALKFCRTFGRTILVTSGVSKYKNSKKTLTKSHDYSRLFSQEKRRLKTSSNSKN